MTTWIASKSTGLKLYKRENGYWYIQVTRGKKIALGTKDENVARKTFTEYEREVLEGRLERLTKEHLILFDEFKTEYLGTPGLEKGASNSKDAVGSRRPVVSDKTYKSDRLAVTKFREWYGNRPMAGITRKKLQEYRNHLLTCARLPKGNGKKDKVKGKLRPNSVNNYIRHLKYALKQAQDWGYLRDPDWRLDFKQVKVDTGQKIWMSEDEVKLLVDTAQEYSSMKTVIPVMLFTGMPRQNICGQIHITDTVIQYRRGKTEKLIEVPIIDKLRPYIAHLKQGIHVLAPFHPDTVGHRFKEVVNKAGIEGVSTHKVRHTFATLMLKAGVDMATVSALLGHASVEITMRFYGHVVDELKIEAMKKFNAILK
ncbi:MAG: tyrosine-type recombinase/integrase [Thermodesulfovibrionales bacterium]